MRHRLLSALLLLLLALSLTGCLPIIPYDSRVYDISPADFPSTAFRCTVPGRLKYLDSAQRWEYYRNYGSVRPRKGEIAIKKGSRVRLKQVAVKASKMKQYGSYRFTLYEIRLTFQDRRTGQCFCTRRYLSEHSRAYLDKQEVLNRIIHAHAEAEFQMLK